jgi:hypothetical protein
LLNVHFKQTPRRILINGKKFRNLKRTDFIKTRKAGWYFDPDEQKGILHIRTGSISTDIFTVIEMVR